MDPRGRVVLITGASSGIGAATARVFAAAGADVALAARSVDRLAALASELPGQPLVVPVDLGVPDQATAMVERVVAERGRVDILINNAGVGLAGSVVSLAVADLERVLAVNLYGPLAAIQAVVPQMRRQGRGQIVNVSSVVGLQALPYLGGYAASKAAFDRLTEALRMELFGSRIAVTLVRPGTTRTGFNTRRLGHGREHRRLAPRGVAPEVVARTLLRAARREPRVVYVSLSDRLMVALASLLPGLAERVLALMFSWDDRG